MEIEINSYVNIKELVGDYIPQQRLDEKRIVKFAEEFGLKDGQIFKLVGNREYLLLLCNYLVESYTDSTYLRFYRNKKFKTCLFLKDILGEYELQNKFDEKTIYKIDKQFGFDEEGYIEVYGNTNEWILLLNFLLENFPLAKKNNNNNRDDDDADFDYISELSSPTKR